MFVSHLGSVDVGPVVGNDRGGTLGSVPELNVRFYQ
jgi:hypothetical protein